MFVLPPRSVIINSLKEFFQRNKLYVLAVFVSFFLLLLFLGGYYYFVYAANLKGGIKPISASAVLSESTQATESAQAPVAEATPTPKPKEETQKAQNSPAEKPPPPPPPKAVGATFAKWGTPNNKFGMYINADVDQIAQTAPLINSNGGAWGWVLIPMDTRQREVGLWQGIFDAAKANRVKPLIQLFNNNTCDVNEMDFPGLAKFLGELAWPTKHLYISVFNEVNAKDYWCEKLAPEEYAVVLNTAIDAFKSVNPNFFVMPAGLNSSARSGPRYLDEEDYLLRMNGAVPGIFTKLDGWATHAYPQPEFSGDFYNPPSWYGIRDQIENYKWELGLLQKHFGVVNLPVFITETGWAHKEGSMPKKEYRTAAVAAGYFDDAYRNHWLPDNRIVAVMPFVWYKSDAPNFNWKKDDGTFYPQYDVVMKFPKVSGTND